MARNRMLKPEFWENDQFGEASPHARLLFIAMLNFADDEGYIEYNLKKLRIKCFPYDGGTLDMKSIVNEVLATKSVTLRNGIIHIVNFLKHQKIDHPKDSTLREIYEASEVSVEASPQTVEASDQTIEGSEQSPEASGQPAPNIKEVKLKEVKGKEVKLSEEERECKGEKENDEQSSPSTPKVSPADLVRKFFNCVNERNDEYDSLIKTISTKHGLPIEIISAEIDKFANYWSERNASGQKQKWQLVPTFEIPLRLGKWFSNVPKFSPQKEQKPITIIR